MAACLLLAFWVFPFDSRAGGRGARSGTGWNDGEMPPVFSPYVEDEAEETDEMRVVLFEGVSRDIPAYVLDGLRRQDGSLEVGIRDYFKNKSFETLFTPTGLLSLYYGKETGDKMAKPDREAIAWVCNDLPDFFEHFSRARQLDALRLEYLRRMEERRLMAELGAGVEDEESWERDPRYNELLIRQGKVEIKGYYDERGETLRELKRMRDGRVKYLIIHLDDIIDRGPTERDKRVANSPEEIVRFVADYWGIPEGASWDVWPQYVWEKERRMRSMEGEALSSPTHLLFLVETGALLRPFAPEEAYRCMSLAWVRQCQAHRELSARIVEILRRSGLRKEYARAVRKWGGMGIHTSPHPASRLGVFVNPSEDFQEILGEIVKFRSQVDF
ncbi:hypothetical protein [Fretibacterium sp. OH1220_COT-178]|uniref:hypothetical protein n=1 Tax=Fretibacterium sp. OH1220_COT-178 TaxID=2491047 RepID=UPI0013151404|nr:hypothetical protein [Fretibacterium sp. OH1220_COT-178]